MRSRLRICGLSWIVLAILLGVEGCVSHATSASPTVTSLTVAFVPLFTAIGQTRQLSATALLPDHTAKDVTNDARWSSNNVSVASVSATGLLVTAGWGIVEISAKYQSAVAIRKVSVFPAAKNLRVMGRTSLTALGDTSRLTAFATLVDGSTRDVTSFTFWAVGTPSVATVSPSGVLTAVRFGQSLVSAGYGGLEWEQEVAVAPPGSFVAWGRVSLPSHSEIPSFHVTDTGAAKSTTSDASGTFAIVVPAGNARLAFDKPGYEHVEQVVAGASGQAVFAQVPAQEVSRIMAGGSFQTVIAPNDVAYDVTPTARCVNCRLIRVISPAAGTLHLELTWNKPQATASLWIDGSPSPSSLGGPLVVELPVIAGEHVLHVGFGTINFNVTLTLATSLRPSGW
jgi:hypothetical protein